MIDTRNQLVERRALPRERLLHAGIGSLHDEELIALMIGNGVAGSPVAQVSRAVMRAIDQANGPPDTGALLAIPGLGPAKAASICAGFEIARRVLCPGHRKVRAPSDILPVVDRFVERKQECFLAISLNGAHEITATRIVTVGLVNRTVVHPREVFAGPLADRAAAVVLAHNHPSGSLEPSAEDNEVTRRLVAAGQLLGIPVLDHVIFSARGYYSFLEHDAL
ncbi:MAG TPA: DNA repair protein RadC [Spirochaetia bacterium]|nr:DNA repair protein RadC [Spirochaetia bacterium]